MNALESKKEETHYDKVVNIAEDGEITVLSYTFRHSDDFKGATGSKFYPVSKAQYRQQTTLKAMEERLRDSVRGEDIPIQYSEHEKGYYANSWRQWAKAIKDAGEAEEFAFDTSYREMWNDLRDATGLNETEAYIFECVGGGRCFDANFQGNVNPELSAIIREFETQKQGEGKI